MKMSKKQNIVASILFVLLLIVGTVSLTVFSKNVQESYALGTRVVSANVSNGADIVAIRATSSSGIAGYYVGTSANINSATFYSSNSTAYNVSLLNGTYHIWVKDTAGGTAKYASTVTVKNSCSSNYISNAKGNGTIKHCYYTANGSYHEETMSDQLVKCADGYKRDESKTQITKDSCSSLSAASIQAMGLSKKVCYKIWSYSCVPTGGGSTSTNNSLSILSATTSGDWTNYNKEITVTSKKGSSEIAGYYISTSSAKPNANSSWNATNSTTWKTTQGAGTYYIWVKDTQGNISNYKSVTVSKIENTAPHIDSVIPSSVNKNLTINASDEGGSGIAGYYASTENTAPTLSSSWNNSNSNTFSINKDPGVYYVWVKDAAGNISSNHKKATIAASSNTDNNSLASLSIKDVEISPAFEAGVTEYTATSSISKIVVDATLQDSNASFVKNFGPRTVTLKTGTNNVKIKVKSALGNTKEYNIKVTYNGKSSSKVSSKLKDLALNSGNLTFDPNITEYRMYVPRSLEKLEVEALPEDENATVDIENPEKLQLGDNKITIKVTATDNTSTTYTLNIIRKNTDQVSTNNYLSSLVITGYKINFSRDVLDYKIDLKNKTHLNINAIAEDSNAEVTIDNTKFLTKDSVIHVMVRAEDGSARIYTISFNKGGISFWKIILIILGSIFLLLLIGYIVLRIMGYNIYINFGVIKDFFLNLFRRNKDD